MRISSSDMVVGYPILLIRKLLVACRARDLVVSGVERILQVDATEARRVLAALEQEGYIKLYQAFLPREQWHTTRKGNTLAGASAARPANRAKAEQRLAEFLERVDRINADDAYVYRVTKVALFGSMLSESPTVGDIDVAIELTPRYDAEAMEERREQRVDAAIAAGRSFPNWVDSLVWPQQEVLLLLKNRSHLISLHEFHQLKKLKTPYRMLVDAKEKR